MVSQGTFICLLLSGCICCILPVLLFIIFNAIALLFNYEYSYIIFCFSYYIGGPIIVSFIIGTFMQLYPDRSSHSIGYLFDNRTSHINQATMGYLVFEVTMLILYWVTYGVVCFIDYYIPLLGVSILYEFGKGLFCLLLFVSGEGIIHQNIDTFCSNFVAFYISLQVILKGIDILGLL